MFFVLAKILGFFALPSNLLISLGLLGILLMATRFARAGRRLAVVGAAPARDRRASRRSAMR